MMLSLLLLTLFVPAAAVQADDAPAERLIARSFELRFKEIERAAAVIRTLLSPEGSIALQPSKRALVVTDRPANLQRVEEVLGRYDVPAREVEIQILLVSASRSQAPRSVPEGLEEITTKLGGVFRFNSFEKLGEITARGREGDPLVLDLDGYRASFRVGDYDPIANSVKLSDFHLDRVQDEEGQPLLRSTLNLRIGQTVVVGASRQPQSARALMLVLRAQ
ncbi:MAG TPA: secretin N-terminal domain-containing protein [Thermoanaerobaculia bacterium]|nr:secretin N-terminal domain-containing protein [Thermoanaerobaculia bacterium]